MSEEQQQGSKGGLRNLLSPTQRVPYLFSERDRSVLGIDPKRSIELTQQERVYRLGTTLLQKLDAAGLLKGKITDTLRLEAAQEELYDWFMDKQGLPEFTRATPAKREIYESNDFKNVIKIMEFYLAHPEITPPDYEKVEVTYNLKGKRVFFGKNFKSEGLIYVAEHRSYYDGDIHEFETEFDSDVNYGHNHVFYAGVVSTRHEKISIRARVVILGGGELYEKTDISCDIFSLAGGKMHGGENKIKAFMVHIYNGRMNGGTIIAEDVTVHPSMMDSISSFPRVDIYARNFTNLASPGAINSTRIHTQNFQGNRNEYTQIDDDAELPEQLRRGKS
jgi:hypothetical protein